MRSAYLAAALVLLSAPAAAGPADVNAQGFYVDAKALLAKGMGAMFDKRTRPRMAQLKAAGEAARDANAVASKAGRPLYCVSEAQRSKGLSPEAALTILERTTEAERRAWTLERAWLVALQRTYPCR